MCVNLWLGRTVSATFSPTARWRPSRKARPTTQWGELDGQWQKTSPGAPSFVFAPIKMCNAMLSGLDLAGVEPVAESVDGQQVARYEVRDAQLDTAVAIWSGQSDMGRRVDTYAGAV